MTKKPKLKIFNEAERFWSVQMEALEVEIKRLEDQLKQIPFAISFNKKALKLVKKEFKKAK
jgi:hypothetical protein